MVVGEHRIGYSPTTIRLGVMPLRYSAYASLLNPFRGLVPDQFELAATVAVDCHDEQALVREID